MLAAIHKMKVTLYSRQWCGWCLDAKDYLKGRDIAFEEVDVGKDAVADAEMQRLSGQHYVRRLTWTAGAGKFRMWNSSRSFSPSSMVRPGNEPEHAMRRRTRITGRQ